MSPAVEQSLSHPPARVFVFIVRRRTMAFSAAIVREPPALGQRDLAPGFTQRQPHQRTGCSGAKQAKSCGRLPSAPPGLTGWRLRLFGGQRLLGSGRGKTSPQNREQRARL